MHLKNEASKSIKSKRWDSRIKAAGIITACILTAFLIIKECFGLFYFRLTHLSERDLEWMNCVRDYPSAIFISNLGDTAKLNYTQILINDSATRFYLSTSPTYDFEANATYRYIVKNDSLEFKGAVSVIRCVGIDSICAKYFLGSVSTPDRPIIIKPKIFYINGRTFEDCIVACPMEDNTTMASYYWNEKYDMKKFVISKEYGLIYYKLEDGEEFFRQFPSDSIQSRSS